jgi:hypothetical protein
MRGAAVADVVTKLMLAHDGLQVAMRSGLARDCWGVLQHGLNLMQQGIKQVRMACGLWLRCVCAVRDSCVLRCAQLG